MKFLAMAMFILMSILFSGPSSNGTPLPKIGFFSETRPAPVRSRCWFGMKQKEYSAAIENELGPWFSQCEREMTAEFHQRQVVFRGKLVSYLVAVTSESDAVEITLLKSSGSDKIDKSALGIIRDTAPFQRPPNYIPYERKLVIEIQSSGVVVKLAPKAD